MGGRQPRGYTVVEVMLFLAISGSMFIVASVIVNGKQANAEFRQSMNEMTTNIRDVINDVANGSYNLPNNIKCTAAPSGGINITSAASQQGENTGCIFMGKVIQFAPTGISGGNGTYSHYAVYTVAGRQFASGSPAVTTLFGPVTNGAYQQAISGGATNLTEQSLVPFGSTVTKIIDAGSGPAGAPVTSPASHCLAANPGAIGIFGSFGSYNGTELESGAQSVTLTCVPYSGLANTVATTEANIKAISSANVYSAVNYKICYDSGNGRKASITIGGPGGQQLAVVLKMGDPVC
ncbi:MAG: hypothetical protein JWN38_114 [Candidatus Saccharibacteria bacterium]|nr:hypothetical protein [Candidatus Saccharibacteria bacterium]